MHINADFRPEIAARNCGFCSIASVGAQIYGVVSSDAHAASGRKQLFAACLRCDRPVGGRNRKSSGLMKSSVQSKRSAIVPGCASFTVLSKYRRRAVSTYALGDFRQKCLKSSPRRGLYFSARQSKNPYNIDIACTRIFFFNRYPSINVFYTLSSGTEILIRRAENYIYQVVAASKERCLFGQAEKAQNSAVRRTESGDRHVGFERIIRKS